MGGDEKPIIGYKYFVGLHLAFCHGPVDHLREIKVADKQAWPPKFEPNIQPSDVVRNPQSPLIPPTLEVYVNGRPPTASIDTPVVVNLIASSSVPILIWNPELFGGEEREGGIIAFCDVVMGKKDEPRNTYLQLMFGQFCPAFRGVFQLVVRRGYVAALNPYIKPWSVYASRTQAQYSGEPQWQAGLATIDTFDMNPAHIIRECLTNQIWGKGRDVGEIDDVSFLAAAQKLYDEHFGLSIVWGDTRDVDSFISTILQHIDATLAQDRITNKWKLKLARDDYDPDTLITLSPDNIISVDELGRPLPSELVNQVTLTYWNRATRKNDTIVMDNHALQDAIGGRVNPNDVDRTAICRTALAQLVCARELRTLSAPLMVGKITVNREATRLSAGDCFKLTFPELGIETVVCRVTAINYGNSDSQSITVNFAEDVFSLPTSTYLVPQTTLWEDPRKIAQLSPYRYVGEAPYWTLVRRLGEENYGQVAPNSGYLVASGSRQTPTTEMWVWSQQGGGQYSQRGRFAAAAAARVVAPVLQAVESTVIIDQVVEPSAIYYGAYAVWDNELVQVLDFLYDTGSLKLKRGVLDTVPQRHSANSRILFVDNHQFGDQAAYSQGETVSVKIVTRTSINELPLGNAPTDTYTFQARHIRPYAPGYFRINNVQYPADIYGNDPTFAWAHRNRLQQTAYMVAQNEGNIGPEAGTTYTFRVRNAETNSIVFTQTGITGTTFNLTAEQELAMGAPQEVSYEVLSVRDGYNSWQANSIRTSRHGLGFQLGQELGGVAA